MRYFLYALFLTGCVLRTDEEALFRQDYVFAFTGPAEHLPAAEEAAAQWNRCKVFNLVIVATPRPAEGQIPITMVDRIPENPNYAAMTRKSPLRIEYRADRDKVSVFAHEMGHVMGLHHYGNSIMRAEITADDRVTEDDCEHLALDHAAGPIQWVVR